MIHAILTDIEGTTSSISFVHDVLFPYARKHIGAFIKTHLQEPRVAEQIAAVRDLTGESLDDEAVIALLQQWIGEDRKVTPLKALQGMIWKAGYENGDFKGHMYNDAVRNLKVWHDSGICLYVFSSGSVAAQKLLFAHTSHGDLTPLFSGYFDTTTGPKQDPASYAKIADAIGLPAADILFLSDVSQELDAAHRSGMHTMLLARDEHIPPSEQSFALARSFDDILTGA